MLFKWRLARSDGPWLLGTSRSVEVPVPGFGVYPLEVQLRHSDGVWDGGVYSVPVEVPIPLSERLWFRLLLVAGALGLSIRAASYYGRLELQRRVDAMERQEALEKERTRIARDMHDVVGARLTQLALLQDVFAAEHSMSGGAQAGLQALSETARKAVSELDEVVWAVNPRNDNLSSLTGYMCHCASEYLGPLGIALNQDVPPYVPEVAVCAAGRHALLLAVKEALQNVVKHSGATRVDLELRLVDGGLRVRIGDNGRGFQQGARGLEQDGLGNMRLRLESVGGTFDVRSEPGAGVRLEFRLPIGNG